MMHRYVARVIFYPTLGWNLFWARVLGVWNWWSRVDDHVILGALPFAFLVKNLDKEGVRAVVNTCEEYAGPVEQYKQFGMTQLRVPTVDFTPPTIESVEQAVDYMTDHVRQGRTVYVHCKAGRGRSATVVLCWLMQEKGFSAKEAQEFLQSKRPQVVKHVFQRRVVQEFARRRLTPPCSSE